MISIRNLFIIYKSLPINILANRGIDFDIPSKGLLFITGPNGSGKSTLLKFLSGELSSDAGEIYLHNELLNKRLVPNKLKSLVSYLPQELNLNLVLSGEKNLRAYQEVDLESLSKIIERFRIENIWKTPLSELDREERQVVALALTLSSRKQILLLDEPSRYLGIQNRRALFGCINELAHSKTVLIATHDVELSKFATNAIHIQDGKIVQVNQKNPQKVKDAYGWKFEGKIKSPKVFASYKKNRNISVAKNIESFRKQFDLSKKNPRYFDPDIDTLDEITITEYFSMLNLHIPETLKSRGTKRIGQFSGGERNFIYLFTLLAAQPIEAFLLYPNLNLDSNNAEIIRSMIFELAASGSKLTILE